jgi:uncharacterized protein
MSTSSLQQHIFTDPVHQALDIGYKPQEWALLKSIVDTRTFQRLRGISQLGMGSYVFPGATHTRFSHCLGAGHLALNVMEHLNNVLPGQPISEVNRREVLCAALLHDVGHGPFSHSFERAMKRVLKDRPHTVPSHEDWTRAIIRKKFSDSLANVQTPVDAKNVEKLFRKKAPSDSTIPKHLRQIVSSQLDVDRMDYLVRDAHFAGVSVGHIDIRYLIRSLAVIHHEADSNNECTTLGLTWKGVLPYETFAFARHLMNRSVYFHCKTATLEFMMETLLAEVIQLLSAGGEKENFFVPPFLRTIANRMGRGTLLAREDPNFDASLDEQVEDYVSLTEHEIWTMIAGLAATTRPEANLANQLLTRKLLDHFRLRRSHKENVEDILARAGYTPAQFALITHDSTAYKDRDGGAVFVQRQDGSVEDIERLSFSLNAHTNRPEGEAFLVIRDAAVTDEILRLVAHCLSKPPPIAVQQKPSIANTRRRMSSLGDPAAAEDSNRASADGLVAKKL